MLRWISNIVGVSQDSEVAEWKGRVQIEQYPWYNVSDLKGSLGEGILVKKYPERPHKTPNTLNVILDS